MELKQTSRKNDLESLMYLLLFLLNGYDMPGLFDDIYDDNLDTHEVF